MISWQNVDSAEGLITNRWGVDTPSVCYVRVLLGSRHNNLLSEVFGGQPKVVDCFTLLGKSDSCSTRHIKNRAISWRWNPVDVVGKEVESTQQSLLDGFLAHLRLCSLLWVGREFDCASHNVWHCGDPFRVEVSVPPLYAQVRVKFVRLAIFWEYHRMYEPCMVQWRK